ncbi:MAG: DUF1549 domain-containing protein [Planctomycetaceae bacterium]|nr:MAG: DUF1549 domain-containing protein [Planctomycetaceae bacterium]
MTFGPEIGGGDRFAAADEIVQAAGNGGSAKPVTADGERDSVAEELFARRISPLFREKCLACHGQDPDAIEGGLDLRSAESALAGGDQGEPSFRSGSPDASPIFLAVTREHADWSPMPPKEANRLTPEEIGLFRRWIEAGGAWPSEERVAEIRSRRSEEWAAEDGVTVATSPGTSPGWEEKKYKPESLWAYRPIERPETSASGSAAIDELLNARLPIGLETAPPADRVTLIRRVTFDLTGLPPSPAEIDAFVSDSRSDEVAFADLVERLLKSPHYGERMAQHWLDVVRYADSAGLANDYPRGSAWRYRDYVIRAFNDDKPYDRFLIEQLAGDELDPDDPELRIATGFLRMGPWELTGMEVARVARQRFLDDVTNIVGETFLAHPLQCARCHDHKFDPIPTRDYYAIQAVFATTQLADREAAFLPNENVDGFAEEAYLRSRQTDHQATLRRLDETLLENARRWYDEFPDKDRSAWESAVAEVQSGTGSSSDGGDVFRQARALLTRSGIAESDYPPKLVGFTPEDFGLERVARKGLERLRWELDRYRPFALSVYSGHTPQLRSVTAPQRMPPDPLRGGELETTCILVGGDPFSRSDEVAPGALSVLANRLPADIPTSVSGRRLALARWVADADNPLTPRVIANRVWMWHFGRGMAGNPNHFGSTGQPPTHPELLDHLAAEFLRGGWSIKSLHRLILNSEAYRRSSTHPDPKELERLDPVGTGYAAFRPRRLTAEELRDAMLAASGELNRTLGGIPNRPEMNSEAALQPRQVMGAFAEAWTADPLPEQRHRRSIYALNLRGLVDPMREVFNAPSADFSCERRETSIVTPQALHLFNGQASHSRAIALAERAIELGGTDDEVITRCFRLLVNRVPTAEEISLCQEHWQRMQEEHERVAPPRRELPPEEVLRDAIEENTGERFSFLERLPAHVDFVPDRGPEEVDARTRALAEIALVLINTHEFAYVY